MSTECSSGAVPGGVLANLPSLPAKRVRREEEEQGSGRSFRRQAETETSGLCDDEPPWAKSLAARRRRNPYRPKKEVQPRRNSTSQMCSPLRQPRGETKFRTKFFCLLFFSRKVGQLKRFMARSAPSFRMHSTASAARVTASSMTFLSSPWNLPSTQSARS